MATPRKITFHICLKCDSRPAFRALSIPSTASFTTLITAAAQEFKVSPVSSEVLTRDGLRINSTLNAGDILKQHGPQLCLIYKDFKNTRTKILGRNMNEESSVIRPLNDNRATPKRGFKVRTTKFRHLKGTILRKETHLTDLTSICKTIPGECDGFKSNAIFCAVPTGPNGNQLAIISLVDGGRRLEKTNLPSLLSGNKTICDFQFDPFNAYRIAVGCTLGVLKIWEIPHNGLTESDDSPSLELCAHNDRVTLVKFHPLVKDLLATASADYAIIIWDLDRQEAKIQISAHNATIFSMSWSPDGRQLATMSKDQKIRVFEPRIDVDSPVAVGTGLPGSRGGRICWANEGKQLIVSGFSRSSERQVMIFASDDLSCPLITEGIDVSPAILVPYFDEDSNTLFLTGKGDSTIFTFEISAPESGSPYLHQLSHCHCPSPHQSVAFLAKKYCKVEDVEFAKGYRLTINSIQPFSVTMPRLRMEFFQDDLFPPTKVLWEPCLSSEEWFCGMDKSPAVISLRPKGMMPLSEAPPPPSPAKARRHQSGDHNAQIQFEGNVHMESYLSMMAIGKEKSEQLTQSMKGNVTFSDKSLPQESFEGVDPDEWNEN